MLPSRPVPWLRASGSPLQAAGIALLLGLVALVSSLATVTYAQISDPWGTLLVSKALATHGTIRLETLEAPHLDIRLGYRLFERGGHQYLVYPLGTPLLVSPVVALAGALGVDVLQYGSELRLQRVIATLVALLTVWAMLRLARRLVPFWPALLCTAVFWSGTSLASVGAATLWSHNLAVLLALLAIDLVVAAELADRRVAWGRLGVCLWLAYLCRPTMAAFAALVLVWVWRRDGRGALRAAAVAGAGVAVFAAVSWREFGEWLPPYYRMGVTGGAFSAEALAGLLVSPSRGWLLFSPVLVAVWAARPLATASWPLRPQWWLVGLGWPVLLVLALSRWEMWWGGGCFGPRLLTDALPSLFLVTLRAWPVTRPHGATWIGAVVLAGAALGSTYIHVVQGLFNPWTLEWNREPSIDTEPWARFTWAYPQFLHSGARHRARMVDYFARHEPDRRLPPLLAGDALAPDAPAFDPLGFDRMRGEGRWTLLQVAELLFVPAGQMRALTLTYGTNGRQAVRVELNDAVLFDAVVEAEETTLTVALPDGALRTGINRLRFIVPDARPRRRGDPRTYGVVVKQVTMR